MLVAVNQASDGNYSRHLFVNQFDTGALRRANEIFTHYHQMGILENPSFQDPVWIVFNERTRVRLYFGFSETYYQNTAISWLGCTSDVFRNAMKTYICFQLGLLQVQSLQGLARTFCQIAELEQDSVMQLKENVFHVVELLQMLPGDSQRRDMVLETLEERTSLTSNTAVSRPRTLSAFRAYFRFHDALEAYWKAAPEEDKLFFFPVYLWWNLTAVIPLRPSEFLLLPRGCITKDQGEIHIIVRRTKLKGGNEKIAYRIDEDYEKRMYPFPGKLSTEIVWYQNKTEHMSAPSFDVLFRREAHDQSRFIHGGTKGERSYSYANLRTCLQLFYKTVLEHRDDISMIQLGDTRHIAMMNLIISGGSPVICKELAGHASIDISSNYYANFSTLVECAAYEQYRKSRKGGDASLHGKPRYSLEPVQDMVRLDDGWCGSPRIKAQNAEDCVSAMNERGEIGDCHCCRYFRPETPGVHLEFLDVEHGKQQVKADSWFLMHIVEAVRRGIGCDEDLRKAILRLQHSSVHYRECLWNSYSNN